MTHDDPGSLTRAGTGALTIGDGRTCSDNHALTESPKVFDVYRNLVFNGRPDDVSTISRWRATTSPSPPTPRSSTGTATGGDVPATGQEVQHNQSCGAGSGGRDDEVTNELSQHLELKLIGSLGIRPSDLRHCVEPAERRHQRLMVSRLGPDLPVLPVAWFQTAERRVTRFGRRARPPGAGSVEAR